MSPAGSRAREWPARLRAEPVPVAPGSSNLGPCGAGRMEGGTSSRKGLSGPALSPLEFAPQSREDSTLSKRSRTSSRCSSIQRANSAMALSSIISSHKTRSSRRRLATCSSFDTSKWRSEFSEQSRRYWTGGSRDGFIAAPSRTRRNSRDGISFSGNVPHGNTTKILSTGFFGPQRRKMRCQA